MTPQLFAPELTDIGICQIPIKNDGSKSPALDKWKVLQTRPPRPAELNDWNRQSRHLLRGIVTGSISENLEVIDIDIPDMVPLYLERIETVLPGIVDRLVRVTTKRGGAHLYYRCEDPVDGNQKLARIGKKTAIETRGEGGYVVAPPSDGYTLAHGDLQDITTIDGTTRQTLHLIARSLGDTAVDDNAPARIYSPPAQNGNGTLRPGDDFNTRTTWAQILEPHGWVKVWGDEDGHAGWRRPGKDDQGISATTGYEGRDILYVFSSNADPFNSETGYSKFTAFALLNHSGDFTHAARALSVQGYGDKQDNDPWMKYGTYINSDLCNGRRFAEQHADTARYIANDGWRIWDGKKWRSDDLYVEVLAKQTAESIRDEIKTIEDGEVFQAMAKWAHQSCGARKIKDMIALAKSEQALHAELNEFDADPYALNCQNGIVDLRTGELRPHEVNAMCARITSVDYDPDADSSEWEAFLNTIMLNDRSMVNYLQDALGYSITGSAACNALFFAFGEGHNGKTTIIESVRRLLGSYSENLHKSTLMTKPADDSRLPGVAKLPGARFVSSSEMADGDRLDEAIVKTLTGSDAITARMLHKNEITFTPTHHIWCAGNHQPKVTGNDEGIWRRIHLIPFEHNFTRPDVRIRDRFYGDDKTRRGILAWLVRGASHWYNNGMALPRPDRVAKATQEYREDMDTLGVFLSERCLVDKTNDALMVTVKDLYQAYTTWTHDNGHRPLSTTSLSLQLQRKGFTRYRTSVARGYLGIVLR